VSSKRYVFLHGSPGDRQTWSEVLEMAPPTTEVHAIDLPDHGAAPDLDDDDPRVLEDALVGVMEELTPGRVTLVGISFGAYLAARVADRLPVTRMVFVAGLPHPPEEAADQFEALADGIASGQIGAADLLDLYRARWLGVDPAAAASRYVEALAADHRPARLARQFRRMARIDRDGLGVATYAVDAVAVHGRHDQGVPLALGRALADLGRGVDLRVLDTDSHLLPLSHAKEVAEVVFGEGT